MWSDCECSHFGWYSSHPTKMVYMFSPWVLQSLQVCLHFFHFQECCWKSIVIKWGPIFLKISEGCEKGESGCCDIKTSPTCCKVCESSSTVAKGHCLCASTTIVILNTYCREGTWCFCLPAATSKFARVFEINHRGLFFTNENTCYCPVYDKCPFQFWFISDSLTLIHF